MKSMLYFILLFVFSSCGNFETTDPYKPSEKEKIANKVIHRALKNLSLNSGLIPMGEGGQMMYDIKMLALAFQYRHRISIDQGRELLVKTVDEFLSVVNQEEKIHPYLANYPFTTENIEIRIFLYDESGKDVKAGDLSVISVLDGVLRYKINDPKTSLLKTIFAETYKEAVQRLEN